MSNELLARIDERVQQIQITVINIEKSLTSNRRRITRMEILFAGLCGFLGLSTVVAL